MQISKSFLVVCAAAYCAALLPLHAADTEAQIKARSALEQKLNELQMQSQAVIPPQREAAPAAVPAPAVEPAVAAAPSAPAPVLALPPAADSESIAKAREALRQKLAELEAQPAQPIVQPAPAPAPAAAEPAPAATTVVQKAAAPAGEAAAAPAPAPKQKPAKKSVSPQVTQSFPQIEGPAPAVAADKQQRLDELLRKYRADQVTPEEYHQQRAKILAEP